MFDQDRGEVEAEAAALCGVLHATTAALVSLLARVLATGAWEGTGIRSPVHWVTWRFGVSTARARSWVRMAERMDELPSVFEAFRAGELAEDQVAVLVRYLPAHNDADGAALAKELSVPVLRRTLRDPPFQVPDDEGPKPERRSATFWFRDEGTFALSAELPADEGALVERALCSARDELVAEHVPGDEPVTWADALVHLSERYLSGASAPTAERYQVVVHVRGDRPGRDASVHLGPALPSALRRYRSCDSTVRDRTYATPSWCEPDRTPSARPIRRSGRHRRQQPNVTERAEPAPVTRPTTPAVGAELRGRPPRSRRRRCPDHPGIEPTRQVGRQLLGRQQSWPASD